MESVSNFTTSRKVGAAEDVVKVDAYSLMKNQEFMTWPASLQFFTPYD